MAFYYQEHLRLQFFGGSPNVTACVLLMALFCAWGLEAVAGERGQKLARAIHFSSFLLSTILIEALVLTYSRGAFVAMTLCLTGLCPTEFKALRKYLVVIILAFLLTPAGLSRIASIGNHRDASITNRLTLWYYGSAMIMDNWMTGTGQKTGPGVTYSTYYQPLEKNEHYWTMVNDGLTLAARHGLPVAFLLFTAILLALACHLQLGFCQGLILCRYMGAAIMSLILCGLFSTMLSSHLICGMALVFICTIPLCALRLRMTLLKQCLPWAASGALMLVAVIAGVGMVARHRMFFRFSRDTIPISGYAVQHERFSPRHGNGRTLLFLSTECTRCDIREVLLPLCSEGFEVAVLVPPVIEEDFLLECIRWEAARASAPPIVFADSGIAANRLLRAICQETSPRMDGVVAKNPVAWHPIERYRFENLEFPDDMRICIVWTEDSAPWQGMQKRQTPKAVSGKVPPKYRTVILPKLTGEALNRILLSAQERQEGQ